MYIRHCHFRSAVLLLPLAALALLWLFVPRPSQAQGLVEIITSEVTGTLGDNGWYVSDVAVVWGNPPPGAVDINGCQNSLITTDTAGVTHVCSYFLNGTTYMGAVEIKRDTTAPTLTLISPGQPQVSVGEGSSLTLHAVAQDVNGVTVGWDLDEDGTMDAPNPTSVTVSGLQGIVVPCWIVTAVDAAGNVSQIVVEATIVNLPPNIDGWVVPSMIHFGGTVQMSAAVSDPGNDPLSAVVHWGDGLIEPVVVKPDGSLTAEHAYATAGSFEVKLQVEDGEGGVTEERRTVTVADPVQTIEDDLIPGTLALASQGVLTVGQANGLVVKLAGAADKLARGQVKTAVHKLNAYLQQFTAVVPNGPSPCFLVATDLRDGLVLHGWVPEPN